MYIKITPVVDDITNLQPLWPYITTIPVVDDMTNLQPLWPYITTIPVVDDMTNLQPLWPYITTIPVVDDATNLQPLWPYAVAVVALLEVVRIFIEVLLPAVGAAVLKGRRLVHVVLTDVVAIHRRVMHVQLETC